MPDTGSVLRAPIGTSVRVTATYSPIVTSFGNTSVRPLSIADVDEYLRHVQEVDADSGVDGAGHSHAYSESEPFDMEAGRAREVTRWSTDIEHVGWRRAWGLFEKGELVSDNPGAQALYARHGFQVLGRTPDRCRVDGQSLDDISMSLNVAREKV